jgi:hypothetical protein|eukprot:scaffold2034_cov270-Chaetoceros_neogracile.AAC.2
MKLNLRRSKSERQSDNIEDNETTGGNEFEVRSGDVPSLAADQGIVASTKDKKQDASLMDLGSPPSTANSTSAGKQSPMPTSGEKKKKLKKTKKKSSFMKKLKQKTSDIFKSDANCVTERITVGDQCVIVSIQSKSVSWDKPQEPMMAMLNNDPERETLKKQKFSLLRKSSSRSKKDPEPDQEAMQRSVSTPNPNGANLEPEQELKKQRFSLVRPFSSRRRNKD